MGLHSTFDVLQLAGYSLNVIGVIAIVLGVILVSRYGRDIREYWRAQRAAAEQTGQLHRAARDPLDDQEPDKRRLIRLAEIMEAIQQTQNLIESRCGTASCPVVPVIQIWMTHAEETIARAVSDMEKSHGEFNDTAKGLFDRFSAWSDKVGSEMVAAIRNGARK